jgi:hypothetical protein
MNGFTLALEKLQRAQDSFRKIDLLAGESGVILGEPAYQTPETGVGFELARISVHP